MYSDWDLSVMVVGNIYVWIDLLVNEIVNPDVTK